MRLSAIIPTRDRLALLQDCLATLAVQQMSAGDFEVIVIDDGSTCDLSPALDAFAESSTPVRLVRQEPSGLTTARNRGASEAVGSVLAYLDDDTLVSPGWASAVADAFERSDFDGLAGRVELQFEAPPPRWIEAARLRLYLSEFDLGTGEVRPLPDPLLPVGANCAVTRGAFDRLGGFREGFDRVGQSLLSNGDLEFFRRLRAKGGRIAYAPNAHVLHRVPAQRLTSAWFRQRAYAQGLSDVLLDPPPTGSRARSLAREVARSARAAPILFRNLAHGHGAMNARLWLVYCRGRRDGIRQRSSEVRA